MLSTTNMFCSRAGCESLKARYNCLGLLSYTFCQPATYYSTIRAIKNARRFTRPRPPFGTPTLVLAPQKSAFSLDTFILACVGLIRDSSALFCSEQFYQRKFYSNDFHMKSQKMTIILGIFSYKVKNFCDHNDLVRNDRPSLDQWVDSPRFFRVNSS